MPFVYSILKNIYYRSSYYKRTVMHEAEIQNTVRQERISRESSLIDRVFDNQLVILNGPFEGMQYLKRATGSALLPKILGSYEEPIHNWIEEFIRHEKYKVILDIGCAEGYYACGFAFRMRDTHVIAYDINPEARVATEELRRLNQLHNLEVRSECTWEELNRIGGQSNTLIFCDIEGAEKELLNPKFAPNLKYADLLIESHDCFEPNITDLLIERFCSTHKIRVVVDYSIRLKRYRTPKKITEDEFKEVTNERRAAHMKFIYMESLCEV